mgnify:CR=1 FL=1
MKSITSTLEEENYLKNVDNASLDLLATNLNIIFEEILDKDGIVSYNNNGTPMSHPAVKIMNDAQRKALEIMREYGLTALARKRLTRGEPEKEEVSPLMNFLQS